MPRPRLKSPIRLDHTIELWSIPAIKNLVKSEVGISFLPEFTVREELEQGELEIVRTDLERPVLSAVCAYHKNKWVSPLMRLFMDLCEEVNYHERTGD